MALTLILTIATITINAQFLFRISGNGLKEPSYMLGTIHHLSGSLLDSIPEYLEAESQCQQMYVEHKPSTTTMVINLSELGAQGVSYPDDKNIAKYNGSKRKIFVAGHSAGGYLLDMIGLDKRWLAKYGVDADSLAALVPFSGQCVTHYNIRKQQGIGPLQATIDQYAPLTYVRADAPPIVIISGDRELELFGRYEEQAYFWRMLKLVGHKDVTLYEMQGYDHGAMPFPAYKILKDHIRRITAKM